MCILNTAASIVYNHQKHEVILISTSLTVILLESHSWEKNKLVMTVAQLRILPKLWGASCVSLHMRVCFGLNTFEKLEQEEVTTGGQN